MKEQEILLLPRAGDEMHSDLLAQMQQSWAVRRVERIGRAELALSKAVIRTDDWEEALDHRFSVHALLLQLVNGDQLYLYDPIARKKRRICVDALGKSLSETENLEERSPFDEPCWIEESVQKAVVKVMDEKFPDSEENIDIETWDFYSPSNSDASLLCCIFRIFESFDLLQKLDIPEAEFKMFILTVRRNYRANPYHNFNHGVDVLQCCYHFVRNCEELKVCLDALELFALFLAAFAHDVGHVSFNNSFLTRHHSGLALFYNDQSPLEHYHTFLIFAILSQPECNMLRRFSPSQWLRLRRLVVQCVLATDMACHFDVIHRLQALIAANASIKDGMLLTALIKCADLCNVARPFELSRKWGFKLISEFFLQGDWERLLHYPVGSLNDRSASDFVQGQIYFIKNIVFPLYEALRSVFPSFQTYINHLHANLSSWQQQQ